MKDEILLELATRWEWEAETPQCMDGSEDAKITNAVAVGNREAKRECADTLRTLISMLGDARVGQGDRS
jgi:hypothetical protein